MVSPKVRVALITAIHSTRDIDTNVASVPPHMRQATMQTEGLSRIYQYFRMKNFATERNMLGVIGETVGWQKRIKNRVLQASTGIDPQQSSHG